MTFTTQQARAADFILSEANGQRSREVGVISAGSGKLQAGTVLAVITSANAATVTAAGGNTGNGAFGSVTVASEATTGTYLVEITEAGADGGTFSVTDPNGGAVGDGEVGVAFSAGGLAFTISDGSTDFVVGDSWSLAVKAGLGEYVPYDDDGTDDGRRSASAVLYAGVDASTFDVQATLIVRDAEVAADLMLGLDANGRADLASVGILVRD